MNNILVLADGLVAEEFIQSLNSKRVADNVYTVVVPGEFKRPEKLQVPMEFIAIDPTSYSKLRQLFNRNEFSVVFILLDSLEETGESLKNIRRIDEKVRVVMLDRWNAFGKLKQASTIVVNANEMLSNHLYNFLPGVPVVARNVGLGEGEIMEVLVPFGSPFAYRHVGSIQQIKWRIAALYRNGKMILPNNATMIRPQDTLLLIGRPQVLNSLYYRIQRRSGMFPEPFGRNLYLYLDMDRDEELTLDYLQQARHLLEKLEGRQLIVRIVNPGDFDVIEKLREQEGPRIDIQISYDPDTEYSVILTDMQQYDLGLIFLSTQSFENEKIYEEIYELKKLVYLFGDTSLEALKRAVILMGSVEEMEAISSTSFYVSETLGLELCLCHFDPEGEFDSAKQSVEHFENLSHIFNHPVTVEQSQVNPVRALLEMQSVLQIVPFTRRLHKRWRIPFLSSDVRDYLLDKVPHPKLLIPVEVG